ncbi:hypothetical protein [Streptomyces sp. NPDC091371]|uniref:hypothetical protein n=1 Tax=Streptomyces sp. NPDC091371 TaxID=3155303 RepID=UPI00343B0BEC
MPPRTRPGRVAAPLLSAVIVAGGLTGCSQLWPFSDCEGTEARVKKLEERSLPLLTSPPPGATSPRTVDGSVYAQCTQDSGYAWLSAGRIHVYAGSRQNVLDHYRKAAEADGWKFEPEPWARDEPMSACFTKNEDGEAKQLNVTFEGPAEFAEYYGQEAGLEFASGSGFRVEIGADVGRESVSCWGP